MEKLDVGSCRFIPCFLLLTIFPTLLHAWNESDHQALGRLALQEVAEEWGLNRPVTVHPLSALLAKLPEEIGDLWHFADWLGINPAIDLEKPLSPLAGRDKVTAHEILTVYSIDPDDGRDQDLFDRDEKGRMKSRYRDQKWFGALQGADSQAFRHIEKPPFSPKHPLATFGFPLRAVGEATRRAQIWHLLSQLAFSLGEEYWGWRFLANSFHYLQDLHNPYHSAQISPALLAEGLKDYLGGGWRRGFITTFADLISKSHRFLEKYVSDPPPEAEPLKKQALYQLNGRDFSKLDDLQGLARQVRDEANRLFPELSGLVQKTMEKKSSENDLQRIFQIVQSQFASTGTVLRTAVWIAQQQQGKKSPQQLLEEINRLL